MTVSACYKNILETSTVTLSAGTSDSSYPLYRVYDRDIGKVFKTTAAVTTEIKVDQGASGNLAIDRLLIPSGHNLAGMTLDIKWSDDDVSYTAAVTQWTGAAGNIDKSWASLTHRYWKFIITSPGSIPQIPELFLTETYIFEKNPNLPLGEMDDVFNVERSQTAGGQVRFLTHGTAKRRRNYTIKAAGETQRVNITTLNTAWSGGKPFWIYDHEGTLFYCELANPIRLTQDTENLSGGLYGFTLDVLEVIA